MYVFRKPSNDKYLKKIHSSASGAHRNAFKNDLYDWWDLEITIRVIPIGVEGKSHNNPFI